MVQRVLPVRYLTQLLLTLAILAFVPGNPIKLGSLLVTWALTFGRISRAELILFLAACLFFTAMNAASLRQGIFAFSDPDVIGMPVWELAMWGFYLLHTRRMLGGMAPCDARMRRWPVQLLAALYAAAFALIPEPELLLASTAVLLVIGLILHHEPADWAYTSYMVALGAAIEYTGVHAGLWHYPGNPPGGVPLWFVTLWGGVGFFLHRLLGPWLDPYVSRATS
jgi:hypothetical protein